jgi:N-acetylglucosamine-6-phosphate deacetylase
MMRSPYALTGARVFDGKKIHSGLAVIIEGAHIRDIVNQSRLGKGMPQQQLKGGLLAPGFIDIQVNGGGGTLFNAEPSPEGVRHIAQAHRRFGTTGLLPTVITDAPEVITRALNAVREAREQGTAGVLGIHVEGPFLDPKRKGAHEARYIRQMTETDIAELTSAACGAVMLTLAPNCVTTERIERLAAAGSIVSLGHSDASMAEAQAALKAGARSFTHLFNAMSQMEGRAAGMVGAALADRDSYCSIIADGHHVQDTVLKVAIAAKAKDRVVLITDAMSSAAGGPDQFELQGRKVTRREGRLQLEDGTLAGSNLTMDEAVRYCVDKLGVPLEDALRMASANPASLIGRAHDLGRIAQDYLASLVHLSDDLQVVKTWVEGQIE